LSEDAGGRSPAGRHEGDLRFRHIADDSGRRRARINTMPARLKFAADVGSSAIGMFAPFVSPVHRLPPPVNHSAPPTR